MPALTTDTGASPATQASAQRAVCDLCGNGPALAVSFRRGIGLLLARQVESIQGMFCRECGLAAGRQAQNRTMWTGWWGIISYFCNWIYIVRNTIGLARLSQLAPAVRTSPVAPLHPGRSVFARSGILVALGLVAVWSM